MLITDGEAELSSEFTRDWLQRSQRDGLTTYAVHIGASAPPVLTSLTPHVITLRSLLPEHLESSLFAPVAA